MTIVVADKEPNGAVESTCCSTVYATPDTEKQDDTQVEKVPGHGLHPVLIFFYVLDNTVVADIQPIIIEDLGEIQKPTWLSVAFLLGATGTI